MVDQTFLDTLAAGTPTPGGGSAAAYSGAAGAALVAMVARLTVGKKKYGDVEKQMQLALERAEVLRAELSAAVTRDASAYDAVMAATKLPKDTTAQQAARSETIQAATFKAAQVPLEVAGMSVEVIELALQVVKKGNIYAISDGAVGADLAHAALRGAGYNVRINVLDLDDKEKARSLLAQLSEYDARASRANSEIQTLLVERGGLPQT